MLLKRGLAWFLTTSTLTLSSCSNMTIGGYTHLDMRNSRYVGEIESKADELATNGRDEGIKAAAEFYGYIGKLDKMDSNAIQYFNRDPQSGIFLLRQCDKVHNILNLKSEDKKIASQNSATP